MVINSLWRPSSIVQLEISPQLQDRIIAGVVSGTVTGIILWILLTKLPQEVERIEREASLQPAVDVGDVGNVGNVVAVRF